jgi:hypothetical protein
MRYLSRFFNEFQDGFQRVSRYTCHLYLPDTVLSAILNPSLLTRLIDIFLPGIGSRIDENFSMPIVTEWLRNGLLCEATRTPSRVFALAGMSQYGFTEHFPCYTEFPPFDCTFLMPLVRNDSPVPRFFNYWQNYIQSMQNGPTDGMDFRFPEQYYGTMYLALYDLKNNPTHMYKFDKVYPVKVEQAALSWSGNNEFVKVPVEFQYSYWTMVPYSAPPLINIEVVL